MKLSHGGCFRALAFDHHVGAADGEGLAVVVLAEHLQPGIWVQFAQVIVRHGEHTAGATCGVIEGLDDALGGQDVAVGSKSRLTIRRMTSRGVKWSPASSLLASLNRRIRSSKM